MRFPIATHRIAPRLLFPIVAAALSQAAALHAEIIGIERFDYSDSTIAGEQGGWFWDFDNFTPQHVGIPSQWDSVFGVAQVVNGALSTDAAGAKRKYIGSDGAQGIDEADGAVNDPAGGPSSFHPVVYYKVDVRTGATLPTFFGLSSYDFGSERIFFGKPSGSPTFGLESPPTQNLADSGIAVAPNTPYTLVTRIDFVANAIKLYVDPDLTADEPALGDADAVYTGTNWSTAVRLASSGGGAVTWDDLVVATDWAELDTAAAPTGGAPPFQLLNAEEIRADFSASWASFSSTHGASFSSGQAVATNPDHGALLVSSAPPSALAMDNAGEFSVPGPRLLSDGSSALHLHSPVGVQGFGVRIEHASAVAADYKLSVATRTGTPLGSFTVSSASAADNAVFLGIIDPAGRIGIVSLEASPGGAFAISDPVFQLGPTGPVTPRDLPVATEITVRVRPRVTYLHEGLSLRQTTPATTEASVTNPNTFELAAEFPGIRAGDILHFQRQGYARFEGSLVPVVAVCSATEVIEDGRTFRRVPGALDAGVDYRSPKVQPKGAAFPTATNIPEDFIVGKSSLVAVPDRAAFLFLSLADPNAALNPVAVTIGHIRSSAFLDWLGALGLHGPLAKLESDLDGDGLSLIEEFAYLRNPLLADTDSSDDSTFAFTPEGRTAPNQPLALLFGARRDGPLRFRAEFSSDMKEWEPAPPDSVRILTPDGTGTRAIFRVVDPDDPAGTAMRRFGRIIIDYIPSLVNP